MGDLVKIALDFLKQKIGATNVFLLAFFCLGIYATTIAKDFIITPEQVDEKVQKSGNVVQLQIYELQLTNLTNELYQLKKLKMKKLADDDDLERLIEVKAQIEKITAKKDSLQEIMINKLKKE
jgi:indole-3-glycerol phosphate synthase